MILTRSLPMLTEENKPSLSLRIFFKGILYTDNFASVQICLNYFVYLLWLTEYKGFSVKLHYHVYMRKINQPT